LSTGVLPMYRLRATPPPMIFSRFPPDSPLVAKRRGHYSTTAAPSVENIHLPNKIALGRRRSLSLDDLGKSNYNSSSSRMTPDVSLSNLCDTEDDLSDFTEEENFDALLNKDDDRELLSGSATSGGCSSNTTGSGTEPEVSSLSTIRESSPTEQRSVEEWSPTPNEEEQIEVFKNCSTESVPRPVLNNTNSASNSTIPRSQSHPSGFVQNYWAKWKNRIKK